MYGELKVRVYFNKSVLAAIGVTPQEALDSLRELENDSIDELCIVPNSLLMPDTWDVVSGPYVISGCCIEERRLVEEVGEEAIP